MSNNKNLGIILLSGILTLGTAPFASSQTSQEKSQKPATQSEKDTGKKSGTTQKDANTPNATDKSTTDKNAPAAKGSDTKTDKSGKAATNKKKKKGGTKTGQADESVREVQQALKDKGKDPGPIDGIMGPLTQKALVDFQRDNNLQASGQIDPQTEMKLGVTSVPAEDTQREKPGTTKNPDENVAPPSAPSTPGTKDESEPPPIKQDQPYEFNHPMGALDNVPPAHPDADQKVTIPDSTTPAASSLEDVRKLQSALKNQGYDPGEINGMMNSDTQSALRQYQAANNLPVTGTFDTRTQQALNIVVIEPGQSDQALSAEASRKPAGTSDIDRSKPSSADVDQAKPQADRTMDSTTMDTSTMNQSTTEQKPSGSMEPGKMDKNKSNTKVDKDIRERLDNSVEVLQSMTMASDKGIPREMLDHAEAIAVIPHVVKGAFGVGGRYGKGVVARRLDNGHWSAPAFISIGGGSFGAQLGISAQDLVLIFTDKGVVNTIEKGTSMKLGADAGISAGPIGRTAEGGMTHDMKSAVYSYSRSKGLFAGVALDGAVIDMDNDANHNVYGSNAEAKAVLNNPSMASDPAVRNFVNTLERIATKRTTEQQK